MKPTEAEFEAELNFEKRIPEKCKYCGKDKGNHLARTGHCPIGSKSRAVGYTQYSPTQTFELRKRRQPRNDNET